MAKIYFLVKNSTCPIFTLKSSIETTACWFGNQSNICMHNYCKTAGNSICVNFVFVLVIFSQEHIKMLYLKAVYAKYQIVGRLTSYL